MYFILMESPSLRLPKDITKEVSVLYSYWQLPYQHNKPLLGGSLHQEQQNEERNKLGLIMT